MSRDPDQTYLSYSGFAKLDECPQQYYAEYILKERPEVEDERNTIVGNALHWLLEQYIKHGDTDLDFFVRNSDVGFDKIKSEAKLLAWRHADDETELRAKLKVWGGNLARLMHEHGIDPAQCKSEFKADSDILIHGQKFRMGGRIDVLLKMPNGKHVFFDLKASANKQIMKIDQIIWYATLMGIYLKDHNEPAMGGYLLPGFGKNGEVKFHAVPQQSKVDLINRIARALEIIKNEEWEAKPSDQKCFWCPVKHVCPAIKQTPPITGAFDLGSLS